jgi:hypothetical protein
MAVIFLIVFFGAWAVSADGTDREEKLSFGFVGGGSSLTPNTPSTSQLSGLEALAVEEGDVGVAGDSWWGKSFLKACPFH